MNKALPKITESEAELKTQLRQARHPKQKQRLQALYLLRSGQARSRVKVAALLGVDRNTVGEWLQRYEQGGLAALLTIQTPPGAKPTLDAAQMSHLRAALARPEGFGSYIEVQQWIAAEFQVEMPYQTVHRIVRYQLRAKLKQPRPVHVEKKMRPARPS
jgi:transposase